MERGGQHGVYLILKSMEQGQTFRSSVPRFAANDSKDRIPARQRSSFSHYFSYIRDETLLPIAMRVASFFPFQITYYLNSHNFIEKELLRLMEALLQSSTIVSAWTTRQIHEAILTIFRIGAERDELNQLRYRLRKLKAHGLLVRDAKRYTYRLTEKGNRVPLHSILFHKQLRGPLANSRIHHRPNDAPRHNSRLESAFHKAGLTIQNIIKLLEHA